ncbi:MAG TPA: NifU family protein [Segeticoccus sp.]|uniref:NifU family protein n=1 Tax=Segeticoccus sp. TaxID=2706531 RepID=UPI002D7F877F|nr:NifU family protein [Segeticoccus sp.]HET8601354.1 NifU family protein [Segeticoccus sp.]
MADPPGPGAVRLGDDDVRERLVRLDQLLEQVEQTPGPATSQALEAIELLAQVYGEALGRVVTRVREAPDGVGWMLQDELLSHLLVLHGLHPDAVEDRVEQALDEVRPYLRSHGGEVTLEEVVHGVARVSLSGSCNGCASSTATLEQAVTESVLAAAPELSGVEAVSSAVAGSPHGPAGPTLIPVEALLRHPVTTGGRP